MARKCHASLLCVHLCKCCVHAGTCAQCIGVCGGQRSTSRIITQELPTLFPETGSLSGMTRWAGEQASGTLLSLFISAVLG